METTLTQTYETIQITTQHHYVVITLRVLFEDDDFCYHGYEYYVGLY